ncbi:MAG TPA: pyridoxamine 5'-phosphate oxidase family protein [Desulfosalsimonadaceae bacterium]|nr:pyridoxamine 5'-phosphate oxidase family protein [Desulfosalsimonadaceae bacterium]
MAQMSNRMKELFNEVPAAVLATSTPDGQPNAVPVGAKQILDDETILISDQFFNKTLANMQQNPSVAVSFWKEKEGYQFKGTATIETSGERYEQAAQWVAEKGKKQGVTLQSKGVAIIHIEAIYGLAPGPGAGKKLA